MSRCSARPSMTHCRTSRSPAMYCLIVFGVVELGVAPEDVARVVERLGCRRSRRRPGRWRRCAARGCRPSRRDRRRRARRSSPSADRASWSRRTRGWPYTSTAAPVDPERPATCARGRRRSPGRIVLPATSISRAPLGTGSVPGRHRRRRCGCRCTTTSPRSMTSSPFIVMTRALRSTTCPRGLSFWTVIATSSRVGS